MKLCQRFSALLKNCKMRCVLKQIRQYCKVVRKQSAISAEKVTETAKSKINFQELKYESKVPAEVQRDLYAAQSEKTHVTIDSKQIQLLERLSLVDLDSEAALSTLQNSIEFAQRIQHISTEGVAPLYTVVELQNLQLREDTVTEGDCCEKVLCNAKVTEEDYFVAPPGNIPLEQEEKDFNAKK